ncbi:hypothetical protein CgunFtcFv8_006004 [Champsocephalus gunnari]|uniref:LRAT domain-containing protein n=1 Tax=Champsocephalus gunnari TaxID=52237 RepID=A0AAN8BZJ8_CHAGU|nr:hypothetical protein CgunFtcFv8_006004 [Champsocephalus gunnari]
MLDTLTFLLEKLFLLAHFRVSSLLPPPCRERAGRSEEPPPTRLLQRGDLLEVPRTLFTHFGIYLGEGRVAHLIPDVLPLLCAHPKRVHEMVTNTRLVLGVLSKHATVRVDSVEDFAYGATMLLNAMDRAVGLCALPQEEVAARAEKLVGPVSYSLLWNNCEHFVTYTRYGTAQSLQTDKVRRGTLLHPLRTSHACGGAVFTHGITGGCFDVAFTRRGGIQFRVVLCVFTPARGLRSHASTRSGTQRSGAHFWFISDTLSHRSLRAAESRRILRCRFYARRGNSPHCSL